MLNEVHHGGFAASPKLVICIEWDWGLDASMAKRYHIYHLHPSLWILSVRIAGREL